MCFGSSSAERDTPNEPAPRPSHRPSSVYKKSAANPYSNQGASSTGASSSGQHVYYAPPPSGPPPPQQPQYSSGQQQQQQQQTYAPPPGPPPQAQYSSAPPAASGTGAPPPPLPPPSYDDANPQHDWQAAVPDTSLFPPPPAIFSGFDRSPTSNATEEEAIAGEEWCEQYPLADPMTLDDATRGALRHHNIRLMEPAGFNGQLTWLGHGHWRASTARNSPDRCLISYPPLYVASEHDPLRTGQHRTIYYEVKLLPDSPTVYAALGFSALPYPSFRMPGWHRGSLAVHGDDGHRFVNDRWGGKEFTGEFRRGETYGIGMTIKPVAGADAAGPGSGSGSGSGGGSSSRPYLVDVFSTRNGVLAGGWNIHEETDAEQDLPVTGLEGFHDICAAVGTYDGVGIEVIFEPSRWLYSGLDCDERASFHGDEGVL